MTTCPKCGSNEAQALLMSVECPRCDGPADEVEEYPDYSGADWAWIGTVSTNDSGEVLVYFHDAEDPCESSD